MDALEYALELEQARLQAGVLVEAVRGILKNQLHTIMHREVSGMKLVLPGISLCCIHVMTPGTFGPADRYIYEVLRIHINILVGFFVNNNAHDIAAVRYHSAQYTHPRTCCIQISDSSSYSPSSPFESDLSSSWWTGHWCSCTFLATKNIVC